MKFFAGTAVLICLFLNATPLRSQDTNTNIYSGGMLILQPGLLSASNDNMGINAFSTAIGGLLRFYPKGHFTAGIIGGRTSSDYATPGSDNSSYSIGYGALFAGYSRRSGMWRFTATLGGGGGKVSNLHIAQQSGSTLDSASLYQYATPVLLPMLSLDRNITRRLYITSQLSCLLFGPLNKPHRNLAFQVGVLFGR